MNFKLDKNRPSRTQSLFQKLNKLTNIKYPSTNDRNISNLYDLNEGNLTDRQPKNIFKINYTIIKNEFPKTKMESNTAKLTVFPNILSHKNSLSSPTQRKITDKKKRSLSENRQFSFSNIVENQTSALFNFKINQFDKPKLHSNYFKENSVNLPNREKKENESSSVNLDNVKVADFQTFKEICEDKEIDKKFKTNSFELNQRNIFKKKIIGTNNNLISVEAVKNTKKPNISLEIDVLEEEYDFGLKIKEESNEKTVFIKDKENDQRDTNKYMNSSNKKMFEANENSLTNVPPFKNNLLNKKENQNLHSENFNRSEKEELSRKNREISIMQIDSDRVSFLKARKKNEIITQVKINDYPNDKDPRINTSIIKRVCLNLKIFYQKLIRFLSCKNFFEKIKTQFNNGLIDVLVTSAMDREIELTNLKTKKIILPGSVIRKVWDVFILFLIFYQLIRIPLIIGFSYDEDLETMALSETFIVIAFFLVFLLKNKIIHTFQDILLNFRTGYINSRGILELYPSKITRRYWRKYFFFDFISALPIYDYGTNQKFLYLLRLLRIPRLLRIVSRFTEYINYHPAIIRIIKSFNLLLYLWHWIACFYWYICSYEGINLNPWNVAPSLLLPSASFTSKYLNSFFFAVTVTTGVGSNLTPNTDLETGYTIFAIVIGVFMYGLILGAASGGFSSLDEGDSDLRKQTEALNGFLRKRKVSLDIQKRIQENLKYVWSSHQSFNTNSHWFLKGVHQLLQMELTIEINKKYLEKVPMFKHITFECMIFMISVLESKIYLPEEFVVYEQQEIKEMFFIQSGLLEVIDETKNLRIRLIEGDFFGEQALINNAKRNASVKSVIYSELLILTREALKKVISIHPNFALNLFTYLKKKISTQLRSRGELSVKFNWSFLIFMVKNAINICKLSDHLLSIGVFLTNSQKNLNKACSKNNIIRLHSLKKNNTEKKRNNKNMYSGIRELSEFVMTKTKNQTSEPNDIKNNTPQGNMKFQYPKIEKISPREQLESGNMTPQQAMKFRFTMKKVQTNLNVD